MAEKTEQNPKVRTGWYYMTMSFENKLETCGPYVSREGCECAIRFAKGFGFNILAGPVSSQELK